jgi:hypothetical protein
MVKDEQFSIESRVSFHREAAGGVRIKAKTIVHDGKGRPLCPMDTKDFGVWNLTVEALQIMADQLVKERQEQVAKAFLKWRKAQGVFRELD